ncbi:MAG: hypothetical protein LPK04_01355 [Caulobacteraceae bacterium]|nr:hypothetical protein [Caulobacteraceae bacterium]
MLIGAIGLTDLRLAGAFRPLPLAALAARMIPVAIAGLALLLVSGALMFAADAGPMVNSTIFRWKLAFILIGLGHALLFHALWGKRWSSWDAAPPPVGRVMAIGSLAVWLTVGGLGRWIAYA